MFIIILSLAVTSILVWFIPCTDGICNSSDTLKISFVSGISITLATLTSAWLMFLSFKVTQDSLNLERKRSRNDEIWKRMEVLQEKGSEFQLELPYVEEKGDRWLTGTQTYSGDAAFLQLHQIFLGLKNLSNYRKNASDDIISQMNAYYQEDLQEENRLIEAPDHISCIQQIREKYYKPLWEGLLCDYYDICPNEKFPIAPNKCAQMIHDKHFPEMFRYFAALTSVLRLLEDMTDKERKDYIRNIRYTMGFYENKMVLCWIWLKGKNCYKMLQLT